VCIVDTGVDLTPDTSSVVVARLAVDGGDGGDVDADSHGTLMTMVAAAPYNGWGMVGAAPVRVVSVRAQRPNVDGFYFDDWRAGIQLCRLNSDAYNIRVVSLSLGGQVQPTAGEQAQLETVVQSALGDGLDVVAAAGNHPGPPDSPASYPPILAVGAADTSGSLCSFAASGDAVDLYALGCPDDVAMPRTGEDAWASGSSEATAFTAGILAQLRALRPDLTPAQAEALLTTNAASRPAGRFLDVAAAFRAAGLAAQLAEGAAAAPRPPAAPPPTSHAEPVRGAPAGPGGIAGEGRKPGKLPRPKLSWSIARGVLRLALRNRPPSTAVRVLVYTRRGHRSVPRSARSIRAPGSRVRVAVAGAFRSAQIAYTDLREQARRSPPLILHLSGSARRRR
jgi:Subtilase family